MWGINIRYTKLGRFLPKSDQVLTYITLSLPGHTVIDLWRELNFPKGPFRYYVIKKVGGWGGQMMMFDNKVGGWWWLNADVIKKYKRKKNVFACAKKKVGIFL